MTTRLLVGLARLAVRRPRAVVGAWVLLAGLLALTVPQLETVAGSSTTPFLPPSAPSLQALDRMDRAFSAQGVQALTFVVLEGRQPLGAPAGAYVDQLLTRLRRDTAHVAEVEQPLRSPDGRALYVVVGIRHAVGSPAADADVGWLQHTTALSRPPGLRSWVTGDAAVYTDVNRSVTGSLLVVTLLSGLVITAILLTLYRSWASPLVPLASIGLALAVARGTVAWLGTHGLTVSTYTGMILMALAMGAGTDYSVFLLSRYHEARAAGTTHEDAVVESSRRIGPVVVASAATVIAGCATLGLAQLSLFRTTGPAIAVAVAVTLAAAVTLTPAVLALLGPRTRPRQALGWARVGELVARRPAELAAGSLALLVLLASSYAWVRPDHDNRHLVQARSQSAQGYVAFARHFPAGQLQPDFLVLETRHDLRTPAGIQALGSLTAAVDAVPGVNQVWALTQPLGHPVPAGLVRSAAFEPALAAFLSADGRTTRLIAYGDDKATHVPAERRAALGALRGQLQGARLSITGSNAGRDDVGRYAGADLSFVALVALAAVLLVLVLLLRSLVAPAYLLASVLLSYAATMGVTNLLFHALLGRPMDFTVPLVSFVVLVSVGADYNILLMARVREESPAVSREGVARAVTSTGKVITTAGLIFAGSFAGMVASPVPGLSETGFAVAFGLLLDTFLVRSMLVPSVAALLGPRTWWPARPAPDAVPRL